MPACNNCTNHFCMSLPSDLREQICADARRISYKKRNEQVLFFDFKYLWIIESGYMMLSRNCKSEKQQGTDILEPGSILGVVQLFNPGYEAAVNFLPLTKVDCCLVRLDLFEKLARETPEIMVPILAEYSSRFGRVVSKLSIHSYGTSRERLDFSIKRVEELGLMNEVRQDDLANLSGLSRVTVSRLLNEK